MSPASVDLGVVRALRDDDFARLHDLGHHWLQTTLLPAVEVLEMSCLAGRASDADRLACSLACHLLGDLYETSSAPRVGIRWYRRALAIWPEYPSAWREIGTCQIDLGEFEAARASLTRALALDPEDSIAMGELAELSPYPPAPRYRLADPCWAAAEALADGRPGDALLALAPAPRAVDVIQWAACAYAAANDLAAVLRVLDELRHHREVYLRGELWFYLPSSVWRERALWRQLAELSLDRWSSVPGRHSYLAAESPPDATAQERVERQLRALDL